MQNPHDTDASGIRSNGDRPLRTTLCISFLDLKSSRDMVHHDPLATVPLTEHGSGFAIPDQVCDNLQKDL
eukprot:1704633-Amphidinium_carterae.1